MKECIHKKGVMCFDELDVNTYIFLESRPDSFKTDAEYIKNIKERKEKGCSVCHFYKNGFKGSAKARCCLYALAC